MKNKKRDSEYRSDCVKRAKLHGGKMLMAYRPGEDEVFPEEWVARHYYGQLFSRATSRAGLLKQAKNNNLELRWWSECLNSFSIVGAIEDRDVVGYGICGVTLEEGPMHILIREGSPSYRRAVAAMQTHRFLKTGRKSKA